MLRFLIIQMIINLIFVVRGYSQEIRFHSEQNFLINGQVLSQDSSEIDYAHVIAQGVVSNKVLNDTFTSDQGYFSLSLTTKEDSILLIFSRLGYVKKEIKLKSKNDYLNAILQFDSSNFLNEVKVIPNVISSSIDNDTISYFADAFTDGTETNVEDLLQRMPGFSINSETGEIKYQGRAIKKILLDGDDLTGANYKVISKNMSADFIDEIEVLKNFSDFRLLKGIKKSEDVAINLKIKEELKSPLFGNANIGYGTNKRYSGNVDLLSYLKTMKLYFVASANNTGKDLQSYELETYMDINMAEYNGFLRSNEILDGRLEAPPYFPDDKFTFQQGQFFSNTMLINTSENSMLRSISTFYNNNLNYNFRDSINYLLDGEDFFVFEQFRSQNIRPMEFFQGLDYSNQLSKIEDLTAKVQLRRSWQDIFSFSLNNFSQIEDKMSFDKDLLYSSIKYQRQLKKKWVFTTEAEGNFDNLKEEISVTRSQDGLIDSLGQESLQSLFNIGTKSSLTGIFGTNWEANLSTSFIYSSSQVGIGGNQAFLSPKTKLTVNSFYLETGIAKRFKAHKVFFRPKVRSLNLSTNGMKHNQVLFEPQWGAIFKSRFFQNVNSELKLFAHREYNLLEPTQLLSSRLLINNRTNAIYQANGGQLVRRDILATNFDLGDMKNTFISGSLEAGYVRAENELISNISFEEEILSITYSQARGVEQSFFSSSLDKYWPAIKSTFKFMYEYKNSKAPLVIESIESPSILKQRAVSFTSGSSLSSSINLSLGIKHNSIYNVWGARDVQLSYNNYNSKMNFKVLPGTFVSLEYLALHFQKSQGGFSPLLNGLIRHTTKNGNFSFEFSANNILNNKILRVTNIELSNISTNIFPIMHNFCLISVKFSF